MQTNSKIVYSALVSALVLASITSPAQAETLIDATNPDAILNIAKGYGAATLTKDNVGDPYISGMIEGNRYGVYFYGCTSGKKCKEIQLRASWNTSNISLGTINTWNQKNRFGHAYLYDTDSHPSIDIMVNLNYGVSSRNLEDTFDTWKAVMNKFKLNVIEKS
jgi:Putative bacterial sensory transduction regulator